MALVGMEDDLDSNPENGTACHSHLSTQLFIVSGSINECSEHLFQDIILRASKLQVHSISVSPRPVITNGSACLSNSTHSKGIQAAGPQHQCHQTCDNKWQCLLAKFNCIEWKLTTMEHQTSVNDKMYYTIYSLFGLFGQLCQSTYDRFIMTVLNSPLNS